MKEKLKLNFTSEKKNVIQDVLSYSCIIKIKSCATYCKSNILDIKISILNDISIYYYTDHINGISFRTVQYSRRRMTLDTTCFLMDKLKTTDFLRLLKLKLQYFPADIGQNNS